LFLFFCSCWQFSRQKKNYEITVSKNKNKEKTDALGHWAKSIKQVVSIQQNTSKKGKPLTQKNQAMIIKILLILFCSAAAKGFEDKQKHENNFTSTPMSSKQNCSNS
jgi:hypothetical protein